MRTAHTARSRHSMRTPFITARRRPGAVTLRIIFIHPTSKLMSHQRRFSAERALEMLRSLSSHDSDSSAAESESEDEDTAANAQSLESLSSETDNDEETFFCTWSTREYGKRCCFERKGWNNVAMGLCVSITQRPYGQS